MTVRNDILFFIVVNTDNTVGAIGFVSRIVPSAYPISIIKVNPDTGEPIRNSDGLCIQCAPGTYCKEYEYMYITTYVQVHYEHVSFVHLVVHSICNQIHL